MGRGDAQGFDSSSPASCGVRCARVWMDARRVVHCVAAALLAGPTGLHAAALYAAPLRMTRQTIKLQAHSFQHGSLGESGWCSDMTSTHGAWKHAGAQSRVRHFQHFARNAQFAKCSVRQMLSSPNAQFAIGETVFFGELSASEIHLQWRRYLRAHPQDSARSLIKTA